MKMMWESSMLLRHPFISATPTRNLSPCVRSITVDSTAFGKQAPIVIKVALELALAKEPKFALAASWILFDNQKRKSEEPHQKLDSS